MFVHKSFKFQNEAEKMKALGCEEFEFITRREDVFLIIIHYLGCVTLSQFNELTKDTPMSNRAILIRLEKNKLITADHINNEIYYRCTKKGIEHSKTFGMSREQIKIKKREHLVHINDFYLHLFRSSCNFVTMKNEVTFAYGDSDNLCKENELDEIDAQYVHRFIADAQVKLFHNNRNYNIILEQDNGSERIDVLKNKIIKYLNFILHQEFESTEMRIYIFRVDIEITNFQSKKFQKLYKHEAADCINAIKKLTDLYKRVKQSVEVTEFFEEAKKLYVQVDYSKQKFLNNISEKKTCVENTNSAGKILFYNYFKSKINATRLNDIKNLLLDDVTIDKFYKTNDSSILFNIIGHSGYSSMDSIIEAKRILLRTNFICAHNTTDYLLLHYLFNDEYLTYCIESYLSKSANSNISIDYISKKQKVIKLGNETLCFDITTTINVNNEELDIILLYPNIFISDDCKVWHIATLDNDLIDSCLINKTVFIVFHDKNIHNKAIKNLGYKTCAKAKFYISEVDDNSAWSCLS